MRELARETGMVLVVVGDARKFDKPLATLGPVREITLENGK